MSKEIRENNNSLLVRKVLKSILEEISGKENKNKILEKVKEVIEEINKELDDKKIKAKCFLGGSLAKGTYLPNDYDADIFVRFDYSIYKENDSEISNFLEQALKKFKPKRVHGSRDYFQFKRKGINFEIVPVLNINRIEEAKNITDVSPLHVIWFRNKADKKIIESVRLSKLFCKANNVYGAESFIKGFSGHVLDILNVNYKSFVRFLREAVKWKAKIERKEKIVIDVENFHKGKALFNLNKSKTAGPIIVIDPIQKDRNAAAALSEEKLKEFIKAVENFLAHPSKKFFEEKKVDEESVIKKLRAGEKLVLIELKPKTKKSVDVIGCKLLKAHELIKRTIEQNDFKIRKDIFYWSRKEKENAKSFFIIKNPTIKSDKKRIGPPKELTDSVNKFKEKHKKGRIKIEKGRVVSIEKRKFKKIESLMKEVMENNKREFKDKVGGVSYKVLVKKKNQ